MINFIIPGAYEHYQLNFKLLDLFHQYPQYFYPDINIEAVFGNFQFTIFEGGRIFTNYHHATKELISDILYEYNQNFGVPVRLVFTNNQITPEHYLDRFSNVTLKLAENNFNEIVINNDGLENYIREKYPYFFFISSTTKCLNNTKLLKEELNNEKYKMVCLDYNLNHNFSFLKTLTQEEKDKCEFLVNAICPSGCPNRKEHYKLNGIYHLNYGKAYCMTHCPIKDSTLNPSVWNYPNNISPEELYTTYKDLGFSHFKLEGRTLNQNEVAGNYVRYMIKPEYQLEAYFELTA